MRYITFLFLLLLCGPAFGKGKKIKHTTWRTGCSRIVAYPYTTNTKDSTLAGVLTWAAINNKVTAYSKLHTKDSAVGPGYLLSQLSYSDTFITEDPLTEKLDTQVKVYHNRFSRAWPLEDKENWTFDEDNGALLAEIEMVKPRLCWYTRSGERRSTFGLARFYWEDAEPCITGYSRHRRLPDYVSTWAADIAQQPIRHPDSSWSRCIISIKYMDTMYEHLTDKLRRAYDDLTMPEALTQDVIAGKVSAYRLAEDQLAPFRPDSLAQIVATKYDTVEMEDPITGERITKVIELPFHLEYVYKYNLLLERTTDVQHARTFFKIRAVGLVKEIYTNDGNFLGPTPIYWVKYKDILPYFRRQEVAQPHMSLSAAVWDAIIKQQTNEDDGYMRIP